MHPIYRSIVCIPVLWLTNVRATGSGTTHQSLTPVEVISSSLMALLASYPLDVSGSSSSRKEFENIDPGRLRFSIPPEWCRPEIISESMALLRFQTFGEKVKWPGCVRGSCALSKETFLEGIPPLVYSLSESLPPCNEDLTEVTLATREGKLLPAVLILIFTLHGDISNRTFQSAYLEINHPDK